MSICRLCFSSDTIILPKGKINVTACNDCEFQFIDNYESYLDNDYFDNYFGRRKENNTDNKNELREKQYIIDANFLKQFIKYGDTILDVGCSSGKFISIISTLDDELKCFGIDIDDSGIKEANKLYKNNANFDKQTLASLKDSDKFDLVTFRGTFQYLGEELHESIATLKKVLKNNGKVVIFSLPSTDSFMYDLLSDKWGLFHPEMSLMFNEKSIKFLADKNNFKIETIRYPYLSDIYANPKKDYENIRKIITGESDSSNPFWGSLMTVVLSNNK